MYTDLIIKRKDTKLQRVAGVSRPARSHRRGDETWYESPNGTTYTGGFDRAGCSVVYHGSVATRFMRRQVPPRAIIAEDGGCRIFGDEEWERVIYILAT